MVECLVMKKNYEQFYTEITGPLRNHVHFKNSVLHFNQAMTYLMYCLYPLFLVYLLVIGSMHAFLMNLLIPAGCFLLLTVIRHKINRKRPYEEHSIQPLIHKEKKGESMPSRHVFSSALISMCWLKQFPLIGILLLAMSALLAWIRVIGGVHYPSDVIAGYLLGIASGLLLFLF